MDADGAERLRILLVDDSKIVRLSARKMIGADCDLVLAESGEEAWARVTSDPEILAVFSDVSMPGLDGYQLLKRIRGDERELVNRLPVVMVTGQDEAGAREHALAQGATDFINKPFDRSALLARTRAYATRSRALRRAAVLEASHTQDSATGLGNARYFETRLPAARAWARRHDQPLTLTVIELPAVAGDGNAGDRATLREAGQVLAHRVREEDDLVHLGDARFVAVCPGCDAAGGQRMAERLLENLRDHAGASRAFAGAVAGIYAPAPGDIDDARAIIAELGQLIDDARQAGDGSIERAGAGAPSAAGPCPDLDSALAMLDTADGNRRLAPHWPALLDQCARLFEAAPAAAAAPALERLRVPLDQKAEGQQ